MKGWPWHIKFLLPQIRCCVIEGNFWPRLHMRRMNTLVTRSTNHSGFRRHYTQRSTKFLILLKSLKFMNVLHNFKDLYTAHHNSLGICYQLKSTICIGILISRPSLFVWGPEACLSVVFPRKGASSTKEHCIHVVCSSDKWSSSNAVCTVSYFQPWINYCTSIQFHLHMTTIQCQMLFHMVIFYQLKIY